MDIKHNLRKMDYPKCALEALSRIESLIINRCKQDLAMDIISEFIFLEKTRQMDTRKANYHSTEMSLVQEFQLVIMLNDFFSRPGPDATRNAVFLFLFGGNLNSIRISILVKLISTSVSGSVAPLLCAGGTLMQQLGCMSQPSIEIAQRLVNDFVTFSRKTPYQLKQLPLVAPRFAANFMTAVADLYMNDRNGDLVSAPDMLLEVFNEWVTDNPSLCLASQQPLALPTGAIGMPVITPLGGLIRWTVLAPVTKQKNSAYSRLHLALLETLLQIPPLNGPATALNAQHLVQIASPLKMHARKLITENIKPEDDERYQSSMDKFAQAVQVALTSKCIYGSVPQLLCILESLPANNLMSIVIKSNKST